MRSRSSKQGGNNNHNHNKGGLMEIEKIKKLKEEPHLSGAYIRSLVKQLTSSRTKDPLLNPKPLDNISSDGDHDHHHPHSSPQNPNNTTINSPTDQNPQNQNPHQQPKKQVRRRLHTSRPYQERLLNMAEARREIVTALKFHRAAMKQANEQQQQQQQNTTTHESIPTPFVQSPPPPPPLEQHEERMKCRRNPRIYPSNNTTTNLDYINNLSSSYSSFSCPLPPSNNPFFCPSSSIAPLPIIDNLNLNLPNQPLGLNLNFHDFTNIDTNLYHNTPTTTTTNNNQSSMNMYTYSSSSPSSSSSPPLVEDPHHSMMTDINEYSGGLHPMLDDDEMAEIRSIGEQHEMEWNDTLNLVTSAWWFKFMKKMEITSPLERKGEILDDGFNVFDEVMEFPAWMNANNNESCFLQQHLDDYYSQDYLQEPALPCMDIEEIDGMDGEWLA